MQTDLTGLDALAWEPIRRSLNRRVVVVTSRLLPSKRNRVWAVETDVRPLIVKLSLAGRAPEEFEALVKARAAGVDVPYPLFLEGDLVVMEYIGGESLERMVNHLFSADAAGALGRWLATYHEKLMDKDSDTIMGDAVLSNFKYLDGRVLGFDLEDSRHGDPLEDVGQAAAAILGSEPFFTPIKFDLCLRLLEGYEAVSGLEVVESCRPFVAKHLRKATTGKPIYRRGFTQVADRLEKGWPRLV